ncbi:MAG TPA: hypothetical protein VGL27_10010 [Negativicutes bacterium]|jgi:hypothetical protein
MSKYNAGVAKKGAKLQGMILFIKGINEFNYYDVIQEKIKPYEAAGWKACLEGGYSYFKAKEHGRYQVTFVRYVKENASGEC